jgi:hypothetical protein
MVAACPALPVCSWPAAHAPEGASANNPSRAARIRITTLSLVEERMWIVERLACLGYSKVARVMKTHIPF